MKRSSCLKIAALAITLAMASCGTQKKAAKETTTEKTAATQKEFLEMVNKQADSTAQFVTSKIKFSVEVAPQELTLTGNLRMKRNDVIRLQLMAFGFVEAARLEFTPDYVLIMDRINKQYLKAPYSYVSFLRNSGINFYTLQALFWNELFVPGKKSVSPKELEAFSTTLSDKDVVINLDQDKINYSWLAEGATGQIKMTNIMVRDTYKGNSQLNWDYRSFGKLGKKQFPNDMQVTLTMPEKEVKLGMVLNYLGNESNWDTRTSVSDKYREVTVDEILRRFMAL